MLFQFHGHGLPQIIKPGSLLLKALWTFFVIVSIGGCGVLIYQSVEQYTQFGVITTTKIKREAEMTFPGVTICSYHSTKIQDMIIGCGFGIATDDCKMINLTLYSKDLTVSN